VLVNYPGAEKFVAGSGGVRVYQAVRSGLESRRQIAKNVTSLFTLLSVLALVILFLSS
jgi:hypothetical protein